MLPQRALLLACALFALAPFGGAQEGSQARPNLLLLFADDQRTDTIGAWGNPAIDTPHLDRLVAEGVSFHRAYCLGSSGGAVCVPSRAMLHTGRPYFGLSTNTFDGHPTLGGLLGEAGYTTFASGKWHNGRETLARSFQSGRNLYLGGMADHFAVRVEDLHQGEFSEASTGAKHSTDLFADAAIDFLQGYEGEQPWFVYVAFTAPHDPRDPPAEWLEHYAERLPPLPANFLPQHPWDIGMMAVRDEVLAGWPREPQVVREQLAEYYGLISHMDARIGDVLAAVEARGELDNTLVVFAADHGLALGSHGLLGKQSVYEHSLRAPLIARGPGVPAGQSTSALVYLLDIMPSLLVAGGVSVPEGLLGEDLGPLWRGERGQLRRSQFLSMGNTQRAVTDGRWKLIRYPRIDRLRLFDLASDPHEMFDLAQRPEQAQRVARLRTELESWQARLGDDLPWTSDNVQAAEIDLSGRARNPDRWQPDWIVDKYFEQNEEGE